MATKRSVLHRYPYIWGLAALAGISGLAQLLVILDCFFPLLRLNPEPVSSVLSTCSEVVAGLYGITLTGYIFFADRFQNLSRDDESLYDAVEALLLRYNHLAGFISLMCLVCIVLGEGLVLYGENTLLPLWLYRLLVNETLLLFFLTFDLILYFVISVLDPHKISRISTQKKASLSADTTAGDAEEFMVNWVKIEACVLALQEKLVSSMRLVPMAGGKGKPQLVRSMETLRNYGRIGQGLWRKLDKLRQYHNLALHDPSMTVSREMCDLAREILEELEAKL